MTKTRSFFLGQATLTANQAFIGGVYSSLISEFGLVLSAVDSRRTHSNDMWATSGTSVSYRSFGVTTQFSSDEDVVNIRKLLAQTSGSSTASSTLTPVDYHEYITAVFDEELYSDLIDVDAGKSL